MKKFKVIKRNNLPVKLPLWQTITCVLALDYWNAPQWLWGAAGLILIIGWIAIILAIVKEKQVDLLKKGD